MARYDYKCPVCETIFEVEHPMSERPVITCPTCGEVAQRVFEASGIVFKGHGFYNTDQRGRGKASSSASAASNSASKSESKDAKTGDSGSTSTKNDNKGSGASKSEAKSSTSGTAKSE